MMMAPPSSSEPEQLDLVDHINGLTGSETRMLRDIKGNHVLPGDSVAYSERRGSCNHNLRMGKVVSCNTETASYGPREWVVIKADTGIEIVRHPSKVALVLTRTLEVS